MEQIQKIIDFRDNRIYMKFEFPKPIQNLIDECDELNQMEVYKNGSKS